MDLNTHLKIDHSLSGNVLQLKEGYAKIKLKTTLSMVADKQGLIHGGFAFSCADFTAMASVNDPYVVLAKSECQFLAPIKLGQTVIFEGNVSANDGRKQSVEVTGYIDAKQVFTGTFYTVVLDNHILG